MLRHSPRSILEKNQLTIRNGGMNPINQEHSQKIPPPKKNAVCRVVSVVNALNIGNNVTLMPHAHLNKSLIITSFRLRKLTHNALELQAMFLQC